MTTVDEQQAEANVARRFKFRETVVSDIGLRRRENQDAYGTAHSADVSLFIVADGMGGARGGGTASTLAVNIIAHEALEEDGQISLSSLKTAIELSNKLIFYRSSQDEELSGMGTTVVALAVVGDSVFVAHVGDSRIYRLHGTVLTQLTRDHTLVQELVDSGAIPPEEAANHPIAHMLTRSLGPTEAVEVELRVLPEPAIPGDKYLLCSDGLYNLVFEEEIAEELSKGTPEEAAQRLVGLALERGGTDNVTVQILEVVNLDDQTVSVQYPQDGETAYTFSNQTEISDLQKLQREESEAAEKAEPPPAEEHPLEKVSEPSPVEEANLDALAENLSGPTEAATAAPPESGDFVADEPAEQTIDNLQPEAAPSEEQTGRRPETEALRDYEKAYRRADEELSKIQYFAYGFVALVVAIVGYSLYRVTASREVPLPDNDIARVENPVAPAPSPEEAESPKPADELLAALPQSSEPQAAVPQVTTVPVEEPSPQAVPETPAPAVSAAPAVEPPVHSDPTAEDVASILGGGENKGKAEEAAKAPPETAQATPAESKEEDAVVEELKTKVNSLEVPQEPPRVNIPDEKEAKAAVNQPIVWEKESQEVEKILALLEKQRPSGKGRGAGEPVQEKVLSKEEMQQLSDQKNELRNKIFDLDAKLGDLGLADKNAAAEKRAQIAAQLTTVEQAIKKTNKDIQTATEELKTWFAFKNEATDKNKIKLADRVAEFDEQVRVKKEAYSEGSTKYLDAVDRWQQDPNNVSLASKMGLLGRVMQKKRNELEQSVTIAIAENIERLVNVLSDYYWTLDNLTQHNDQLNRHTGYLELPITLNNNRKKEMEKKYQSERAELAAKLRELQQEFSDDREIEFRRLSSASVLGLLGQ